MLASCAALLLQVSWTRIFSVSHWYHMAFLVVGTAMLGHGIGGTGIAISRRLKEAPLPRALASAAVAMTGATLIGFAVVNAIPFSPFSLTTDPWQIVYMLVTFLAVAAPFACAGFIAALLLHRHPRHAGSIYCFDLLGAGIGAISFVFVVPSLGGSGAVLISAMLSAAAAACFVEGRWRWAVGALTMALAWGSTKADPVFPIRIEGDKTFLEQPVNSALASSSRIFSGWTSASRIDVLQAPWGPQILIDAGTAMTRVPVVNQPLDQLGPTTDERNLALPPGRTGSVLVIGSGGGADVLAALQNGATRVVAVEVNPLINMLVRGQLAPISGNLFWDPRVELHTDEARSFVRRSSERFDAILASHTISNAATASGALAMAEDYLLTVEAFEDYLAHLSPTGALFFTRPESQLPRLVATMREALHRRGIEDAANRLIVFADKVPPSFYGGVVLRLDPYRPEEAEPVLAELHHSPLRILYLPPSLGGVGDDASSSIYQLLVTTPSAELPDIYRAVHTRIDPVDDDRPFFNQRARFNSFYLRLGLSVFSQPLARVRLAIETLPVAETVLVVILCESAMLAAALIGFPLLRASRSGATRHKAGALLYFFLLGLGYILLEVALVQRLTLFIGRPEHSFAVVIGTLLVASSVGSVATDRLAGDQRPRSRTIAGLLGGISLLVATLAIMSPAWLRPALGLPLPWRVGVAVLLVALVGLPLGAPFPLGIRILGREDPDLIPWAWGLNAVSSVIASALAVLLALAVGFSGVLLVAASAYAAAGACMVWRFGLLKSDVA
jgi:hypothetical protein